MISTKEYNRNYYMAHREEILAKRKKWYEEHKDDLREVKRERNQKYYRENYEAILKQHKAYRDLNREKVREYWKSWYALNKGKHQTYYQENRQKILAASKEYYLKWTRDGYTGKGWIDEGKIRALTAAGWSASDIAFEMNLPEETILEIQNREGSA